MDSIKIGSGSFATSLLSLPLEDFLNTIQINKAFQGYEMRQALTRIYNKANDTKPTIKEIDASPEREVRKDNRKGGKRK